MLSFACAYLSRLTNPAYTRIRSHNLAFHRFFAHDGAALVRSAPLFSPILQGGYPPLPGRSGTSSVGVRRRSARRDALRALAHGAQQPRPPAIQTSRSPARPRPPPHALRSLAPRPPPHALRSLAPRPPASRPLRPILPSPPRPSPRILPSPTSSPRSLPSPVPSPRSLPSPAPSPRAPVLRRPCRAAIHT